MRKISENMLDNLPMPTKRLQNVEDHLMEKLFDPNIIKEILNDNHTNIMHSQKNNSNTAIIDRTINPYESTNNASVFDIDKNDLLETTLMDFIRPISAWLIENTNEILIISTENDTTIGHGVSYDNGKLKEYTTKTVTMILTKDDRNDAGFRCKTSYPDITDESTTRTPTGRNLIPDLIQTRTFKKADTNTRTKLIQATINGLDHRLSPIEHIYANIVAQPAFTNDMQITTDNDQITIRHPNANSYSTLHISTKETYTTNGCTPELARLKTFIENKFKIQSKESTNTTRKDKKPLTRSELAQNKERINNEVREELFGNRFDNQKDDTQLQ